MIGVCNTVETIIVYLVSRLSKTFKNNPTNPAPRESPSQSLHLVELTLHGNRMRADRSEAACKRHRHHEKLSPKNAASFVSPLNTSAPALFSSASLFSDRPSARTLSPALSKPSVIFLPVLPGAPMMVTKPGSMRSKFSSLYLRLRRLSSLRTCAESTSGHASQTALFRVLQTLRKK